MKKYRIIHIIPSLNTGGAENVVKNYALNINKELFDFEIVVNSIETNSVYYKELKDNDIKVSFLGSNNRNYIEKMADFKSRSKRLFDYLVKAKPDIVHMHLSLYYLSKKQYKILHDMGVKYCYTCHSDLKKDLNKIWQFNMAKYLINNCEMSIISLNEKAKADIRKRLKVDSTIITNGVVVEKYINKDGLKKRNELGIPNDYFVLGHVGSMSKAKNHKFIIDVFNRIHSSNSKSLLLLVVGGENDISIINYIENNNLNNDVLVLNNRKDVNELLSCMDAFIFPSLYEGYPVSLIEAQISGLRCVVSDTVTKEACISSNTVFLSLNDEIEKWADELTKNNKLKTIVNYENVDLKNTMKKVEKFYKEIITYA